MDYSSCSVISHHDIGLHNTIHTLSATSKAKWHQRSYNTKDFSRQDWEHFSSVWVMTKQFKNFSSRHNYFLELRTREVAMNGSHNALGPLQSQIVQIHGDLVILSKSWLSGEKRNNHQFIHYHECYTCSIRRQSHLLTRNQNRSPPLCFDAA